MSNQTVSEARVLLDVLPNHTNVMLTGTLTTSEVGMRDGAMVGNFNLTLDDGVTQVMCVDRLDPWPLVTGAEIGQQVTVTGELVRVGAHAERVDPDAPFIPPMIKVAGVHFTPVSGGLI